MEDNKDKENIQEVKLNDEALKAISEAVMPSLSKSVKELASSIKEEIAEESKKQLEEAEKTIKKNITEKNININKDGSNPEKETKEKRFIKSVNAFLAGDKSKLKSYNEFALESRQKAGYANTDTSADGGYVVLDPEFEAEVEKLEPDYSIVVNNATIVRQESPEVKTNKKGSNVTMYEVGQGATITSSKLGLEQISRAMRKFAGLAISTNEMIEDQAVDFWSLVTDGFAQERSRIMDTIVFTDTNATQKGLLEETTDIITETVGASIGSITWDDLLNAESAIPTNAAKNVKHYMHRTVWNILRQTKDDQSRYQSFPVASPVTPWGTPIVVGDIMPSNASTPDQANKAYVVTGDLKRFRLYIKRGLTMDTSEHATVTDTDSNTVNLFEQDMQALRVKTRMLGLNKFPEAFCITGTGTVS